MEPKDIALVAGMVGSNLAGFGIIAKFVAGSVMKHNETLPVIAESVKVLTDSIKELYESRNEQMVDIERLKQTHHLKGCDQPITKQGGQ